MLEVLSIGTQNLAHPRVTVRLAVLSPPIPVASRVLAHSSVHKALRRTAQTRCLIGPVPLRRLNRWRRLSATTTVTRIPLRKPIVIIIIGIIPRAARASRAPGRSLALGPRPSRPTGRVLPGCVDSTVAQCQGTSGPQLEQFRAIIILHEGKNGSLGGLKAHQINWYPGRPPRNATATGEVARELLQGL